MGWTERASGSVVEAAEVKERQPSPFPPKRLGSWGEGHGYRRWE
jgi:hypothetical protein